MRLKGIYPRLGFETRAHGVRITPTNAIGEKAEVLTLDHDGEGTLDKRGTLYFLAIGVDKYPGLNR